MLKITDIHADKTIYADSISEAMPELESWYKGAPADQWPAILKYLKILESGELDDRALESFLGLKVADQ